MNRTGKVLLFVIFFIGLVGNSTQLGDKDHGHKKQSEDHVKYRPYESQHQGHKENNHHEVCDPEAPDYAKCLERQAHHNETLLVDSVPPSSTTPKLFAD
ncbi:hypothetical protein CSKR_200142 [Clonorchis sinensis]|uniref:Uncharacterized protein n=1 Tax=Clonorchis sinensis TaxID=79923 RepID=A0A8T1LZQ5_CLOSI|nr:hypothetical protein CSKR_200142 [Clonorchis sinensis]